MLTSAYNIGYTAVFLSFKTSWKTLKWYFYSYFHTIQYKSVCQYIVVEDPIIKRGGWKYWLGTGTKMWRSEFRVVLSVTISQKKRWSFRLYHELLACGLMSYLRYLYVLANSTVQHILLCVFALFFFALCTLYSTFSGLSIFRDILWQEQVTIWCDDDVEFPTSYTDLDLYSAIAH